MTQSVAFSKNPLMRMSPRSFEGGFLGDEGAGGSLFVGEILADAGGPVGASRPMLIMGSSRTLPELVASVAR